MPEGSWETAVEADESSKKKKGGGFQSLGLGKDLLNAILKQGYTVPTPIQRKAIPVLMQGNDVVAMARTGSGKTAAFLIPMIHLLKEHSKIVGIRGLILSPTRELSMQILRFAIQLNAGTGLRFAALVGGSSLDQQFELMASNPDIVVATPGRLLHIVEEASLQLSVVKSLVLDEADRLFEMGLQPQIVAIMQKIPESSQRALFSATMPSVLAEFTSAGLHNPVVIRLDAETKLSEKLQQSAFLVRNEEKVAALIVLLKRIIGIGTNSDKQVQALVFVESKFHVDYLNMLLEFYMIPCTAVHGQMDQEARRNAVRDFAKREKNVMIVTDVAARGIDLPLLDNVINFSFPFTPKLFVHRVGRVARAGRSGTAYSIMTYDDFPYYVDLMWFLNRPLCCRKEDGDFFFSPEDGCYGRMPEDNIQIEVDFIQRLLKEHVELQNMAHVVSNAHKKFTRTKKKPSHEAIQEAKKTEYRFESTPIHPIFTQKMDSALLKAFEARQSLRNFKPKESYFESISGEKLFEIKQPETIQSLSKEFANHAENNKKSTSSTSEVGPSKKTMKGSAQAPSPPPKPRSLAETLLLRAQERKKREREETPQTTEEDPFEYSVTDLKDSSPSMSRREQLYDSRMESGNYRDQEFFMEAEKRETAQDAHYSVKDATFDMTAETAQEAQQQRQVFAWSKKKNRYVKMHVNDAKALVRGMKNEAGKAIDYKTKLEAYSKWTKKSNMRIQDVGEEEDLGALKRARDLAAETKNSGVNDDENDDGEPIDMNDLNRGKKLRIGRKQKRLPKDGHVLTFEELSSKKRKAAKEKAKLAKKAEKRRKK